MAVAGIADLLRTGPTGFSFEFFPPKTAGGSKRLRTIIEHELLPLEPAYVSVTYGAGGSSREQTHTLVTEIQQRFGLTVVAHLTCVGSSRDEIAAILDRYAASGVKNILALRGDPPKQPEALAAVAARLGPNGEGSRDFPFAVDLVAFIKSRHPEMCVGVGGFPEGHPATPNRLREIDHMRNKISAGADYIVTQLFFDNRDYFDYVSRLHLSGIDVPVVPGIMPVAGRAGLERMADLAAGARIPAALLRVIARAENDDAVARIGTHWATAQVADLLNAEVPGIHLYTLNTSRASIDICKSLGLTSYRFN